MDDIGALASFEAANIEVFIHKQLKDSKSSPEYIADELLKKWDAFKLPIESKKIVAKFCLLNGFLPSLLRILKLDLRSGAPLPWAMVLELFYQDGEYTKDALSKNLADALLTGAARDGQLHDLTVIALSHDEKDPRWKNILDSELKDRLAAKKEEREKLFKEVQIFKAERMDAEVALILNRILTIFPEDIEAKEYLEKLTDQELEVKIHNLKEHYQIKIPFNTEEPEAEWPNLEKAIKRIQKNLNIEETYLLSVALFQMNLYTPALEVLHFAKAQWKIREKLWEVDLLLSNKRYAEALSTSQIILNQNRSLSEIVKATLYYSARAFQGLGDQEQAISILRGIMELDPHFRDTSILLKEWIP